MPASRCAAVDLLVSTAGRELALIRIDESIRFPEPVPEEARASA